MTMSELKREFSKTKADYKESKYLIDTHERLFPKSDSSKSSKSGKSSKKSNRSKSSKSSKSSKKSKKSKKLTWKSNCVGKLNNALGQKHLALSIIKVY